MTPAWQRHLACAPWPKGAAKGRVAKLAVGDVVDVQGIDVHIDRPKGFVQEGTGPDGKPWRRLYLTDYGEVRGTMGGDGEALDVFLGPDLGSPLAVWITQVKQDGSFDEYKCFLGFPSVQRALLCYALHIPRKLAHALTVMTVGQMKALLGLEPGEVIHTIKRLSQEVTMGAKAIKKDDDKGASTEVASAYEGSGGADIVALAAERLNAIVSAMKSDGLTAPMKADIVAIMSLLEAVCDSPDLPEVGADMGADVAMSDAEKAAGVQKRMMTPEQFTSYAFLQVAKIKREKDPEKKAKRIAALQKATEFADAWGESSFSSPSLGLKITMYRDPAMAPDPQTVTVPAVKEGQTLDTNPFGGAASAGSTPTSIGTDVATRKALESFTGAGDVLAKLAKAEDAPPAAADGAGTEPIEKSAPLPGGDEWPLDIADPAWKPGATVKKALAFGGDRLDEKAAILKADPAAIIPEPAEVALPLPKPRPRAMTSREAARAARGAE